MEESSSATDVELTDTAFEATPDEVQQRIEDEVASFLQLLRECEEPAMSVTSRASNNAVFCKREKHIRLGTTTVKRKLSDGKRYQGMWKVLQACYALMKERKTVNQRELYYLNTDMFATQRECDDCIRDCIALLHVPRDVLGITATPKGYVSGRLLYSLGDAENWTDLSSVSPLSIAYSMVQHMQLKSDAKLILVVEKDGIFKRLIEDRFFDTLPCILITGRGFPDFATRLLLHHLYTELHLPVFGLCDWNPYGMSLLMTYIVGSLASGLETYRYCVPITWIGLHYEDIIDLHLPDSIRQPFTKMDDSKCCALSTYVSKE
ncbi:hypothetical protein WA577_003818 [Blastocystis sp. JDR]